MEMDIPNYKEKKSLKERNEETNNGSINSTHPSYYTMSQLTRP
jgi:hypothetical protein